MKQILKILIIIIAISCAKKETLALALNSDSNRIQKVMQHPEEYELQILYTQIDRSKKGKIQFTDFGYNVNDSSYFYPASSVKLPIALMALEKVKKLNDKGFGITRKTNYKTKNDTAYTTIENDIIKIFAVSSNQSYNRLFEFLGQDHINSNLKSKNILSRISHRLSAHHSHNPKTQAIFFKKNIQDSDTLYHQPSKINKEPSKLSLKNQFKGVGYIYRDSLIQRPKDFSEKNYVPIRSLHEIMKRIHFPEAYKNSQVFDIMDEDRNFVIETMNTLPYEAGYNKKKYHDSYVKFFIYGDSKKDIPKHLKIFNKVGYAYGYLTDCAYIKNTKTGIEFLLTATIHVNKNKIYNDDTYEYDEVGIPFLAQLGREIYKLEKIRRKIN